MATICDSQLKPFKYEEPGLTGDNIRLISLVSKDIESDLEIKLEEYPVNGTEFVALSYVWGDVTDTQEIICNQQRLKIGQSLYEALNARRVTAASSFEWKGDEFERGEIESQTVFEKKLWVDAICINQTDTDEKTHQVRMMGEIYRTAQEVFVWLGPSEDEDLEAIAFAESFYMEFESKLDANNVSFKLPASGRTRISFSDFARLVKAPQWPQVFKILSHPWFSRVWVTQELILAKHAIAQRGSYLFGMHVLLWISLILIQHRDLAPRSDPYDISAAGTMATIWRHYRHAGPMPLFNWVRSCRTMKATDPRDKFFALVGISHSIHPAFVDYSDSQDFYSLACWVGGLALLGNPSWPEIIHGPDCLALNSNPQNHSLGLPSWVPDWFSDVNRGKLDLGTAFSSLSLKDHRHYRPPKITGFGPAQVEYTSEKVCRYTQSLDPTLVSFKVCGIGRVRSIASTPVSELCEPVALTERDAGDALLVGTEFQAAATSARSRLTWLYDLRRTANPSMASDANIMAGEDFEAFLGTLHYNFEGTSPEMKLPMYLSFGYWVLREKFIIACYDSENAAFLVGNIDLLDSLARRFDSAFQLFVGARNFFVSSEGRSGWVPLRTEVRDRLFIFQGSRIPFVARPIADQGWKYIGPCYVHGLMHGEAWDAPDELWWNMKLI